MSYRLTEMADEDIARILRETLALFGPRQVEAYAALIEKGLKQVGLDPLQPGSIARDELGLGIRSLHLQIAARRRGSASHVVYFLPMRDERGFVAILRVLHDRMDPKRHLILSRSVGIDRDASG